MTMKRNAGRCEAGSKQKMKSLLSFISVTRDDGQIPVKSVTR